MNTLAKLLAVVALCSGCAYADHIPVVLQQEGFVSVALTGSPNIGPTIISNGVEYLVFEFPIWEANAPWSSNLLLGSDLFSIGGTLDTIGECHSSICDIEILFGFAVP